MKAIHDANYATPAESWAEYVARLQYLAEMKVGRTQRQAVYAEDAMFARAVANAERTH